MKNAERIVATLLEDSGVPGNKKLMEGDELKDEMGGPGADGGGPPRRLPSRMPMARPGGGGQDVIKDLFLLYLAKVVGPDDEMIAKAMVEKRPLQPGHIQHLVDEFGRMELTPPQQQALDALRAKLTAGT